MKFFVLQQDKKAVEVERYLEKPDIDPEFARFIRREALGEILVRQSNDKPKYLAVANKLGCHPLHIINTQSILESA